MNHFVCCNNWESEKIRIELTERRAHSHTLSHTQRKLKCNEKLKRWLYLIKAQGLIRLNLSHSDPLYVCVLCGMRSMTASAKCIKIFSAFDSTNDEIICGWNNKRNERLDLIFSSLLYGWLCALAFAIEIALDSNKKCWLESRKKPSKRNRAGLTLS